MRPKMHPAPIILMMVFILSNQSMTAVLLAHNPTIPILIVWVFGVAVVAGVGTWGTLRYVQTKARRKPEKYMMPDRIARMIVLHSSTMVFLVLTQIYLFAWEHAR